MTIKEFRLSQKLSQAELATALGISVSSERQYEYGKREPNATVVARIKEIYGVDLNGAAPAVEAAPAPAVEEKAAKPKRTRKKKDAAAEAAPAAPAPAVEEAPAKPKRTRKKKEAAVEAAPVVEEKVEKPAKRTRKKKETEPAPVVEEKVDVPAKKPRARKKIIEKDPLSDLDNHSQKKADEVMDVILGEKKGTVIIQSPMGGEITPEEILAKVGPVDKVYVRVDLNTAFWVRGEESGAVNLW